MSKAEIMTGCTDTPVQNTAGDLFNVTTYVNGLCSFIGSCDTPMTISIQGDWGSGKTSMMNMIRTKMQDTVVPIWFNTWQFSQFDMGNTLAFSMMDVLLKGLNCDKDVRKKILKGLVSFGKKAVKIATDQTLGGEVADAVGNLMDGSDEVDYASEIVDLKDKFQAAVNATLEQNPGKTRVVVFVDDLDRLQPSRAVELLEVLKLFLDCEKCVFVLAVDYEVVTLGIRQKYGAEVDVAKGKSFFDKIIQLPFKMPVAQYDISNYVEQTLKRQGIQVDAKECELYANLIRTSIGFNPRSMKRLFNTYQLLNIITGSVVFQIQESVRQRVLFAIICAQMSYEKFYQYLVSTKDIEAETLEALADKGQAESVMKEILQDNDISDVDLEKRVRHLTNFMPYFIDALQIDEDGNLSEEELSNMTSILKCSLVTSVSGENENEEADLEYEYRNANKEYAKKVKQYMTDLPIDDDHQSGVWLPRKANRSDGVSFSDVSYWYSWKYACDTWVTLDCYFARKNDTLIDIRYYLTCSDRKQALQFHELLGDNPLELSESPEWLEWGRYKYMHAHQIGDNDDRALKRISEQMRTLIKVVGQKAI